MLVFNFKKAILASAVASLLLVACGGGGGGGSGLPATSSTLSGTAAGGTAMVGNVLVTDSNGITKTAAIAANGQYTIDVSGMTGPFLLKASGKVGNTTVTYYSAATTADLGGTVNVTPFTDLIVSNIAAQLAVNYFSNPANMSTLGALITPASLAAAETAMQAKLQPALTAMGLGSSVDLLHQAFAADHSGLDAVLDLVKVSTNTSTNVATLTNALTNVVIGTATLPATQGGTMDQTPIAGTDITPSSGTQAQFNEKLNAFAAMFALGLPSTATLEGSGVFDTSSNFMMSGQTFAQFETELSTNIKAVGMKFNNVQITIDTNCATSCTTGKLTTSLTSNDPNFANNIKLNLIKDATKGWLIQGDGFIADISLSAQAVYDTWTSFAANNQQSTGTFISNGLWIYVDPFAYNSTHASGKVVSAVVTGPGLDSGGISMVQDTQNTWFDVAAYSSNNSNLIPECGTTLNGPGPTPVVVSSQCVTVANAVDNSVYTVVLKDSGGNSLNGAGYQLTLSKQPYAFAALSSGNFPTISSITIGGNPITLSSVVPNASIAVSWTMPTGLVPRDLNAWANTSTTSYFNVQQHLLSTATQTLVSVGTPATTGTPINAGIWLEGIDSYGRRFATNKSMQTQ